MHSGMSPPPALSAACLAYARPCAASPRWKIASRRVPGVKRTLGQIPPITSRTIWISLQRILDSSVLAMPRLSHHQCWTRRCLETALQLERDRERAPGIPDPHRYESLLTKSLQVVACAAVEHFPFELVRAECFRAPGEGRRFAFQGWQVEAEVRVGHAPVNLQELPWSCW